MQSCFTSGRRTCGTLRFVSRIIVAALGFLMGGCALLFSSGDKEIGVIPAGSVSGFHFRTVLPRRTDSIRFVRTDPGSTNHSYEHIIVSLTNTSTQVISVRVANSFREIRPRTVAQLYDGSLESLLSVGTLPISSWSGRASCGILVQFPTNTSRPAPIRVVVSYSSPPL